jgi:uncharacterized repeat protein (TIGR03803 family)
MGITAAGRAIALLSAVVVEAFCASGSADAARPMIISPWQTPFEDSLIYRFAGGNDGQYPYAGLVAGKSGTLHGTTLFGGGSGFGTVYKLTPQGSGYIETVIYRFLGYPYDGAYPQANVMLDPATGALYGTTTNGGIGAQVAAPGPMRQSAVRLALTAVQPEAIIYTPTNVGCQGIRTCQFTIDLDNDGKADFTIFYSLGFHFCSYFKGYTRGDVGVMPASGRGVMDGKQVEWAAALDTGDQIGPLQKFDPSGSVMTFWQRGGNSDCGGNNFVDGYWLDTGTHYLGLKFPGGGRAHYGWAQLTVTEDATTLTGYAYQTKAGKSILAGQQ